MLLLFDHSARFYALVLFATTTLWVSLTWILGASAGPNESPTAVAGRRVIGVLLLVVFACYAISIAWGIYRGYIDGPIMEDTDSDSDGESAHSRDGAEEHGDDREDHGGSSEEAPLSHHWTAKLRAPRDFKKSLVWDVLVLLVAVLVLMLSGYILSHTVTTLAHTLNLSTTSLGLTLMSIATTLPEKFIAVFAGRRGHQGILVANTVGSNIFLLTLCAGLTFVAGGKGAGLVGEVTWWDLGWLWMSAGLLLATICLEVEKTVTRRAVGWLMLAGYALFLGGELGGWGR